MKLCIPCDDTYYMNNKQSQVASDGKSTFSEVQVSHSEAVFRGSG